MENTDFNNASGLSGVEFNDGENISIDKMARAYEFYESGRYSEALNMAEGDPQFTSSAYGQVLIGSCYKRLIKTKHSLTGKKLLKFLLWSILHI